jgi:hypothetical protein
VAEVDSHHNELLPTLASLTEPWRALLLFANFSNREGMCEPARHPTPANCPTTTLTNRRMAERTNASCNVTSAKRVRDMHHIIRSRERVRVACGAAYKPTLNTRNTLSPATFTRGHATPPFNPNPHPHDSPPLQPLPSPPHPARHSLLVRSPTALDTVQRGTSAPKATQLSAAMARLDPGTPRAEPAVQLSLPTLALAGVRAHAHRRFPTPAAATTPSARSLLTRGSNAGPHPATGPSTAPRPRRRTSTSHTPLSPATPLFTPGPRSPPRQHPPGRLVRSPRRPPRCAPRSRRAR